MPSGAARMEHMTSATIKLFLPRGDAKSLRTAEINNSTLKRLLSLLILAALAGLLHSFRTGASLTDGLGNGCQRAERIPERQRILGRRSMEPIRGEQFRAIAHY
jgi:hypothetical protein